MMDGPTRLRVAGVARSWIGTPFYPHCAIRGVGADCVQLALAVYQEAGVLPVSLRLPRYRLDAGDSAVSSMVLRWLGESKLFREGPLETGNLVVLNVGKVEHHVGIVTGPDSFVQTLKHYGVREYPLRDSTWIERIKSHWEPV